MPMINPPHPGGVIRTEIIEAHNLTVSAAAKALCVSRQALSSVLNGQARLSGKMALRIENTFGPGIKKETLMGMQSAYDHKWSHAEKVIARRAFDQALQREFAEINAEVKERTAKIEHLPQLWELEEYLAQRRNQIARQYDYRYSKLIFVFGELLRQGKISEQDLQGLDEAKLKSLRQYAQR